MEQKIKPMHIVSVILTQYKLELDFPALVYMYTC